MNELWYQQPADNWDEALPIGNGRLGAMIYGRTETEMLQLNEDSMEDLRTPKDALKYLSQLREAILAGNHTEAEKLAQLAFFANPISQRQYEPLGTLFLDFEHRAEQITGYQRSLDISSAITRVEYEYHGVQFKREAFASFPDNVFAIHVKSSSPAEFFVRLTRMSELKFETNEYLDDV